MLLAWLAGCAAVPAPSGLAGVAVFGAGMANVSCFRIPSIVQVPHSGALVAFAEARRGDCDDGDAHQLATRTSKDGGATWGDIRFVAGDLDSPATFWAGNPTAVITADGRLLLALSKHAPGCVGNCVVGSAVTFSDDDGASWSAPVDITAAAGKARTGPGLGLLLAPPSKLAGRLLLPASLGTYGSDRVVSSSDGGASWRPPRNVSALPKMDEAQATQLPNGSVLLMMRHVAEPWMGKAASVSDDGGESWGPIRYLGVKGPVCQSSITTIGNATFYSGPDSTSHVRSAVSVWRSDDSAASFPAKLLVDAGPSAYSCLVPAALARGGGCGAAGCGGLLYEAGFPPTLTFVRFPLDLRPAPRGLVEAL